MNSLTQSFQTMPWTDLIFYKTWLAQSFYYTTHSTRMLAFAAGWSSTEDQKYYKRSVSHIREEQSHDLLAVRDLEKLGDQRENFAEFEVCRALWEPQFYKIQRNPKLLLGYILALEELAVFSFPELYKKLTPLFGTDATHFIRVHAEDDPEHVEEALKQIQSCSPVEVAEIMKNYDQTCVLYERLLFEVRKSSQIFLPLENQVDLQS